AHGRTSAQEFGLGLREKDARVEFALKTDPQKSAVDKAVVKVDGRMKPAWRTSRYDTTPSGSFSGPDPSFVGECVLFHVADTDSLVYVALDAKRAGTSLDRLLDDFSVQKTSAVNKAG